MTTPGKPGRRRAPRLAMDDAAMPVGLARCPGLCSYAQQLGQHRHLGVQLGRRELLDDATRRDPQAELHEVEAARFHFVDIGTAAFASYIPLAFLHAPDSLVTLHYRISVPHSERSQVRVSTFESKPATLQLGRGELSPALEICLIGLPVGHRETFEMEPGDVFVVETPGGGGYGPAA